MTHRHIFWECVTEVVEVAEEYTTIKQPEDTRNGVETDPEMLARIFLESALSPNVRSP